jgi:hypothetical protein
MPNAAEAAHAIERVGLEGRLRRFIDRTRTTAVFARKLAEAGDEEAKRLFSEASRILDKVRRLLDDDHLVAARAELVEAEAVMTELARLVTARQREIDPEQAAKAEQEDAERVADLISSAPAAIAARIRARRELIAAATHRHEATDDRARPS